MKRSKLPGVVGWLAFIVAVSIIGFALGALVAFLKHL